MTASRPSSVGVVTAVSVRAVAASFDAGPLSVYSRFRPGTGGDVGCETRRLSGLASSCVTSRRQRHFGETSAEYRRFMAHLACG